jgi:hypothetical protein
VAGGRNRGEDVVADHAFAARRAHRSDGQGVESRCEEANSAVVADALVHNVGSEAADPSTPSGRRFLPTTRTSAYKFMKKDSPRSAIVRVHLMRPQIALLIAVAFLAATAASDARILAKTDGATSVQLDDGMGYASVKSRGNLLGRVHRGRIIATRNVHVNGCSYRRRLDAHHVFCRGKDITVRTVPDTRWRVRMRGHGIAASGIVRGCLVLDARNSGSTGTFRIGSDGGLTPWPRERRRFKLGTGTC